MAIRNSSENNFAFVWSSMSEAYWSFNGPCWWFYMFWLVNFKLHKLYFSTHLVLYQAKMSNILCLSNVKISSLPIFYIIVNRISVFVALLVTKHSWWHFIDQSINRTNNQSKSIKVSCTAESWNLSRVISVRLHLIDLSLLEIATCMHVCCFLCKPTRCLQDVLLSNVSDKQQLYHICSMDWHILATVPWQTFDVCMVHLVS